jgi:hypothetical protein
MTETADIPPLTVRFTNESGFADKTIFVSFVGGAKTTLDAITVAGGTRLALAQKGTENWYALDMLKEGISVTTFVGGRVFFAYGGPLTMRDAGYEPSPTNPSDANYLRRYDKMEMTYSGGKYDVADTTSMDFFSIPIALKARKGGAIVASVSASPADPVKAALAAITDPAGGALVKDGSGNFVRIIGPGIYPPPPGLPASPYDNFTSYLTYLRDVYAPKHGGVVAKVQGLFGGVGENPTTDVTKRQDYDFTATIDADLNIMLRGRATLAGEHTLLLARADLTAPTGIYGANPMFSLDGAKPSNPLNDVFGWMIGDLLAGFNIGAVGSEVVAKGATVGEMPSQSWFGLGERFETLQPGRPGNYNRWASTLTPLSQAYNFAYTDRVAHVFAPLNPAVADTLEIVILPDGLV